VNLRKDHYYLFQKRARGEARRIVKTSAPLSAAHPPTLVNCQTPKSACVQKQTKNTKSLFLGTPARFPPPVPPIFFSIFFSLKKKKKKKEQKMGGGGKRINTPIEEKKPTGQPKTNSQQSKKPRTTFNGGSLGSCIDEERSKLRYVM
jgi:hypothetical protein